MSCSPCDLPVGAFFQGPPDNRRRLREFVKLRWNRKSVVHSVLIRAPTPSGSLSPWSSAEQACGQAHHRNPPHDEAVAISGYRPSERSNYSRRSAIPWAHHGEHRCEEQPVAREILVPVDDVRRGAHGPERAMVPYANALVAVVARAVRVRSEPDRASSSADQRSAFQSPR
jgi:hypothetical protein